MQATAVAECTVTQLGDSGGDGDAFQTAAAEGIPTDPGDIVGDVDGLQSGAIVEQTVADAGQTLRQSDGGQVGAIGETVVADIFHALGDHDGFQVFIATEGFTGNGDDRHTVDLSGQLYMLKAAGVAGDDHVVGVIRMEFVGQAIHQGLGSAAATDANAVDELVACGNDFCVAFVAVLAGDGEQTIGGTGGLGIFHLITKVVERLQIHREVAHGVSQISGSEAVGNAGLQSELHTEVKTAVIIVGDQLLGGGVVIDGTPGVSAACDGAEVIGVGVFGGEQQLHGLTGVFHIDHSEAVGGDVAVPVSADGTYAVGTVVVGRYILGEGLDGGITQATVDGAGCAVATVFQHGCVGGLIVPGHTSEVQIVIGKVDIAAIFLCTGVEYVVQIAAINKGTAINVIDITAQDHITQIVAAIEGVASDGGDALGKGDALQVVAAVEHTVADLGQTGGKVDAFQRMALIENAVAHSGDAVGEVHVLQLVAAGEGLAVHSGQRAGQIHCLQIIAVVECAVAQTGNTLGDRNALQIAVIIHSIIVNGHNRHTTQLAGDDDIIEAAAIIHNGNGTVTVIFIMEAILQDLLIAAGGTNAVFIAVAGLDDRGVAVIAVAAAVDHLAGLGAGGILGLLAVHLVGDVGSDPEAAGHIGILIAELQLHHIACVEDSTEIILGGPTGVGLLVVIPLHRIAQCFLSFYLEAIAFRGRDGKFQSDDLTGLADESSVRHIQLQHTLLVAAQGADAVLAHLVRGDVLGGLLDHGVTQAAVGVNAGAVLPGGQNRSAVGITVDSDITVEQSLVAFAFDEDIAPIFLTAFKENVVQGVAVGKGQGLNLGDIGTQVNRLQCVAAGEQSRRQDGNTAADGGGLQIVAVQEQVVAKGGHAVGNVDLLQAVAILEGITADGSQRAGEADTFQSAAAGKAVFVQRGDALGNGNGLQLTAAAEGAVAKSGDSFAVQLTGNGHIVEAAVITADGDGAIIIFVIAEALLQDLHFVAAGALAVFEAVAGLDDRGVAIIAVAAAESHLAGLGAGGILGLFAVHTVTNTGGDPEAAGHFGIPVVEFQANGIALCIDSAARGPFRSIDIVAGIAIVKVERAVQIVLRFYLKEIAFIVGDGELHADGTVGFADGSGIRHIQLQHTLLVAAQGADVILAPNMGGSFFELFGNTSLAQAAVQIGGDAGVYIAQDTVAVFVGAIGTAVYGRIGQVVVIDTDIQVIPLLLSTQEESVDEIVAVDNGVVFNASKTTAQNHKFQSGAVVESTAVNSGNAVADIHALQCATEGKSAGFHRGHTIRDPNLPQCRAAGESAVTDGGEIAAEGDVLQSGTTVKCVGANYGDGVGENDAL